LDAPIIFMERIDIFSVIIGQFYINIIKLLIYYAKMTVKANSNLKKIYNFNVKVEIIIGNRYK